MGVGKEIGSAIGAAATDIFKVGYDIWSNQRDFDYQKNLQNDVFAREDNAVQRRVADLKAAGLNPNLAAGSAAGTGSVVGRSNTPSISGNPVGTALDMASHVQQLRQQKTENQILKNQEAKSAAEAKQAENDAIYSEIDFLNMMGINPSLRYNPNTKSYSVVGDIRFGKSDFNAVTTLGKNGQSYYEKELNAANAKLMQYLQWQYQNNQNSAAMLQKDNDFYIADKVGQYLGQGVQLFTGAGQGYWNFTRRR